MYWNALYTFALAMRCWMKTVLKHSVCHSLKIEINCSTQMLSVLCVRNYIYLDKIVVGKYVRESDRSERPPTD